MSSLKRKEHITWRREESIMEQIISLVTSEVNTKHRNLLPYTLWLQCKPLIHRACFIHYTISVCFMTNSGSPFIETHNNEACGHDSREHRFSPQRGQFECAIVGWPGKNNKWATLEISCPDVTEEQKSHWEYSPDVTVHISILWNWKMSSCQTLTRLTLQDSNDIFLIFVPPLSLHHNY